MQFDSYAELPSLAAGGRQDSSVALSFASSLPLVAAVASREQWQAQLKPAFDQLRRFASPAVLQQLVSCAPALAEAVGEELAAADVLPAVVGIVSERAELVKAQLAASLCRLIAAAPADHHAELMSAALQVAGSGAGRHCGDWRVRKMLAAQLGPVAACVSMPLLLDYVEPCCYALTKDSVAAVRQVNSNLKFC